jgi:hypothetical protein
MIFRWYHHDYLSKALAIGYSPVGVTWGILVLMVRKLPT